MDGSNKKLHEKPPCIKTQTTSGPSWGNYQIKLGGNNYIILQTITNGTRTLGFRGGRTVHLYPKLTQTISSKGGAEVGGCDSQRVAVNWSPMKKFQFLRKQIGLFDYVFVQAHWGGSGGCWLGAEVRKNQVSCRWAGGGFRWAEVGL